MSKRSIIAAFTMAAAIGSTLLFASPASAANVFRCPGAGSDPGSKCTKVIGIDPGSSLTVRNGPGTNYPRATGPWSSFPNGATVELMCWSTGTPVYSYDIWVRLDIPAAQQHWVSDYYLDTGYVQNVLPHC
ncbi:hypothetical protein OG792_12925 [Micromonospora sp. NBC_01699]|uniref:hypothetical protein n=1 Tax=Micromonospora sp. NBC_01699 TaxID=2975984 RepID=UPI002E2EAB89|nr:hypothetical protein [Micromonospora sp. NBC_01699]